MAVHHRSRGVQSEVADLDDAKALPVRAVFELAPGHQAEARAAGDHGELKVFPEYLSSHAHGSLRAITRALKSGPAAASNRIQDPSLAGQISRTRTALACALGLPLP